MRLLILNWMDRTHPLSGGAEIHLHELFGRLARRPGWEITLVASRVDGAPAIAEVDGIQVHRAGGRYGYTLAAPRKARELLSRHPFDLVLEDLNKVPLFAPLWSPVPVAVLVHHLFGGTAFQEAGLPIAAATWLLERPVPRVFRGCPVVAVSESTKSDLVARGMDPGAITVIPNGIDPERLTPHPEGERFPEPTLLYLGRLKRYKRVDLPIRAMARLAEAGIPARLLIAGKGDNEPALRAEAARLGLGEDRVRFLGFVSDEEKLDLFRRSWVHLLTSPKEGWGIANLEAAACGTPTVASDAPGLRDSVVDGTTGYLVPHGDEEALVRRISHLLNDGDMRRRMGREARAFAETLSWDRAADRMEGWLGEVAGGGGRV